MLDLDSEFVPGTSSSYLSSEPEVNTSSTYSSNTTSSAPKSKSKFNSTTSIETYLNNLTAIVCLSHLRWDFVYQRPQHLLSRFAKHAPLYFFEEPYFYDNAEPWLETSPRDGNVTLVVAHLPNGLTPAESDAKQIELLNAFIKEKNLEESVFWYYTPMALEITRQFNPSLIVFDVMDELSAFKFAPPRLLELEEELIRKADVVFTGGQSLYEAKKHRHEEVYAFPSSIEKEHFAKARTMKEDPADQAGIPHPRMGFYGVVDERFDIELLGEVAKARPEWQFVIIGPVVKIDPAHLPKSENIHYLGGKSYAELPSYLAGWDVAMMPFALNESTKYISPTKTPEYLAGGKPVVSTPITDVINPYGDLDLVHIAEGAPAFEEALEKALAQRDDQEWLSRTDSYLTNISWDKTWQNMVRQMQLVDHEKNAKA